MPSDEPEKPRKIKPELIFVRLDVTSHWQDHLLAKYRIKKIYDVYLYDYNSHTYCAELTPSYEMWYCDYCIEFEDDVDDEVLTNDAHDAVAVANVYNEDVIYIHASSVDKLPAEDKDKDNELTDSDEWQTAEGYNQMIQDWIEGYRGNPTW